MWHDLFCQFKCPLSDKVTWPIFCQFQCTLTMWHYLFPVRFSAPWQYDITYFLSVSVHQTMWHDQLFCLFTFILHFPLVSANNLRCFWRHLPVHRIKIHTHKWSQIMPFFQYITQKLQNGFINLFVKCKRKT